MSKNREHPHPTVAMLRQESEARRTVGGCRPAIEPPTMRQGRRWRRPVAGGPCFRKSESFSLSSISLIAAASRINAFAGHGRLDVARCPRRGQRFSSSAPWRRSMCCLDDCHSRYSRASAQGRAAWRMAFGRAATARRRREPAFGRPHRSHAMGADRPTSTGRRGVARLTRH